MIRREVEDRNRKVIINKDKKWSKKRKKGLGEEEEIIDMVIGGNKLVEMDFKIGKNVVESKRKRKKIEIGREKRKRKIKIEGRKIVRWEDKKKDWKKKKVWKGNESKDGRKKKDKSKEEIEKRERNMSRNEVRINLMIENGIGINKIDGIKNLRRKRKKSIKINVGNLENIDEWKEEIGV